MATDQDKGHREGLFKVKMSDMMDDSKTTEIEDDDNHTCASNEVHQKQVKRLGLLSLPGEIRNKIYRLVLVQHPGYLGCEHLISSLAPPPLTMVNKQTLAEALPIYYAENQFYLLLWATGETLGGQDASTFHRFTGMVEHFGRLATSTEDQSPIRYIKNIVVQIIGSKTRMHSISHKLEDILLARPVYNHVFIRGEQQSITHTSHPATGGKVFDPTRYCWTVGDVRTLDTPLLPFVSEAYDLLISSFSGPKTPIERAVRRLVVELEWLVEEESSEYSSETSELS